MTAEQKDKAWELVSKTMQVLLTTSIIALASVLWSTKGEIAEIRTEVAILAKDVNTLIKRDVVRRADVTQIVRETITAIAVSEMGRFPWGKEREAVMERIRRLENKAGIEGD